MDFAELLLIAVGLSMDAFAVSVCKGLSVKELKGRHVLLAGLYFGTPDLWGRELPLGAASQVKTGEATLYSAADGTLRGYSCRIIRLKVQSAPGVQGMMVEVTDQALLSLTGGIVPGMSGSPVVQNGRLVGVVTHVFVNEPRRGYCVYAQWMLEKLF